MGNKAAVTTAQQRGIRRHLVEIAEARLREVELLPGHDRLRALWTRLANGWAGCGWTALFRARETGTLVGLPDHCDRPLCPYCERGRRTARIRDRYREVHDAALADRRLFLATLTIPNVPLGQLERAFEEIRQALERLRRQRWWSELVAGGLWRLELTVNLDERTWHPHANLLFETNRRVSMQHYLQEQLQRAWRRALGNPAEYRGDWTWLVQGWDRELSPLREAVKHQVAWRFEAENEPAGDPQVDVRSSVAYAVKPPGAGWIDAADPAWVVEYVETQFGRRAVGTFGTWRKVKPARTEHGDEELVEAPYVPGDDFFVKRYLPAKDPLTGRYVEWELYGRGPRSRLRAVTPPGGDPWLVWSPGSGEDPATAEDDIGPPIERPRLEVIDVPLPSEYQRRDRQRADRDRSELHAPPVDHASTTAYVGEAIAGDPPPGYRRGKCSSCGGGVALPRAGVAYWSAAPAIVCSDCVSNRTITP